MAQQTTPEILSFQLELENLIASLGSNLKFHIFSLLTKHLENDFFLKADDIEKGGKNWLSNILLIMFTQLGFGMSMQERQELMDNLRQLIITLVNLIYLKGVIHILRLSYLICHI